MNFAVWVSVLQSTFIIRVRVRVRVTDNLIFKGLQPPVCWGPRPHRAFRFGHGVFVEESISELRVLDPCPILFEM